MRNRVRKVAEEYGVALLDLLPFEDEDDPSLKRDARAWHCDIWGQHMTSVKPTEKDILGRPTLQRIEYGLKILSIDSLVATMPIHAPEEVA